MYNYSCVRKAECKKLEFRIQTAIFEKNFT